MGDVLNLRLRPLIRVELVGAIWTVSVRPCPPDIPSMKSFKSEADAAEFAADLSREYGWRIRPDKYGATALPGAA